MKAKTLTIDARLNVARTYRNGRCYAVRFSKDMSAADIVNSLVQSPPARQDWQPYNEATGEFV